MWYFSWVLGVGFVVLLVVFNVMWGEVSDDCVVNVSSVNLDCE